MAHDVRRERWRQLMADLRLEQAPAGLPEYHNPASAIGKAQRRIDEDGALAARHVLTVVDGRTRRRTA